jgi:hypothetical protein
LAEPPRQAPLAPGLRRAVQSAATIPAAEADFHAVLSGALHVGSSAEQAVLLGIRSGAHPAASRTPPFGTSIETGVVGMADGTSFRRYQLSAAAFAAARALDGDPNHAVVAAAFKVAPSAVSAAPSRYTLLAASPFDPGAAWDDLGPSMQSWLRLTHDVLLAADGSHDALDPDVDEIAVQRIAASDAAAVFQDTVLSANGLTADDPAAAPLLAQYAALSASMLHGLGRDGRVYVASWDDTATSRTGLFTANKSSGEIRCLVVIDPP